MKNRKAIAVFIILCAALISLGSSPAQTTENDVEIIVQSSQDSGKDTFRAALQHAQPGTVIRFSDEVFPLESPTTIQILSALPHLQVGLVTIDASNAGVILDGSQMFDDRETPGLVIISDGNIIMGLQIINFPSQGIQILDDARENRIGGLGQGEGNVIGGNWDGIGISGTGTANNTVIGNFIGTDASGTVAYGNLVDGIWIGEGAHDNIIGGRFGIEGNVISGNGNNGIVLDTSNGNLVTGNIIGLAANGVQALGNGGQGISMNHSASGNTIGGLEASYRNVVSANLSSGINVHDPGTSGNRVIGNDIGLSVDGKTAAGNTRPGVEIGNGAQQNEIGPGNRIAYNGQDGILVDGEATIGNIVTRNSIYANEGKAINNLHGSSLNTSPPEISQVSSRIVRGNAAPGQLVEIFSHNHDESDYFEGEVIADNTGAFNFVLPSGIFHSRILSATARATDGSTSEFSETKQNTASGLGQELPGIIGPIQISTEPAVIGTNLALASIAVVYFGFTTVALNGILKNNSAEINNLLGKLIPEKLKSFFNRGKKATKSSVELRWKFLRLWILIVLVNAIIESFLDPYLAPLAPDHLKLILTLFIAGLLVSGFEWISDHYSHRFLVKKSVPRGEIQTAGLLMGIATYFSHD